MAMLDLYGMSGATHTAIGPRRAFVRAVCVWLSGATAGVSELELRSLASGTNRSLFEHIFVLAFCLLRAGTVGERWADGRGTRAATATRRARAATTERVRIIGHRCYSTYTQHAIHCASPLLQRSKTSSTAPRAPQRRPRTVHKHHRPHGHTPPIGHAPEKHYTSQVAAALRPHPPANQ
jgi:hypothetical protein